MTIVKDHPLAAIAAAGAEQFESSANKQATTHAQVALELLDQFGQAESTQSRVQCLFFMATDGLTCEEFDECMADALTRAKQADKAAGFKAADDAKGRDLYGPRQSSLASNASNARQVFGCFKVSPEAIVKAGPSGVMHTDLFPNFSNAYGKAVAELRRLGVNWKGQPVSVIEQAAKQKKANNAAVDIETAAKLANPQQAGETIEQWEARIEALLPEFEQAATDAAASDAGEKLHKSLCKKYGDDKLVEAILIAALKAAGYEIA
jgi:hypothetical protein